MLHALSSGLLLFTSLTSATTVFVSSYAGTVSTLSLTEKAGNYSLSQVGVSNDCAPNPSWLTLDANRGLLFCLNEGLETVNGSMSSYTISLNGSLTHVQNTTTISGLVSGIIYGEPASRRGIALAHYTGSAVTSWYLDGSGKFSSNQNLVYTLNHTGAVPDRQEAPHEHEAIIDPTGRYLLVSDLGADMVRVYSYNDNLQLQELAGLKTAPGDGPRHAAFYNPYGVACEQCTTFLYVSNELGATVKGYAVTYQPNGGGLSFEQVYNSSTYGYLTPPQGLAPSEIHVSPDNRFLLIGNRNDSALVVSNPNPDNSTMVTSDTISTFALKADGTLNFVQLAPAYGSFPRQFSTNAIGNLVGVGLQYSNEVVILSRDITTGLIGPPVASIEIEGQITCVVFYEEYALGRLGA